MATAAAYVTMHYRKMIAVEMVFVKFFGKHKFGEASAPDRHVAFPSCDGIAMYFYGSKYGNDDVGECWRMWSDWSLIFSFPRLDGSAERR